VSPATSIPRKSRLALGVLCALPACVGPQAPRVTVERVALVMGTSLSMQVSGPDRASALAASELALRAVEATEARLSTWRTDSELSRIFAQAPGTFHPCSSVLASELGQAARLAARTAGAFDPTIAPLVAAWDLRGTGRRPHTVNRLRALRFVDFRRLRVQAASVSFEPGTRIEEGGFGKGAALDAAQMALAELHGIEAQLDLGGQISLSAGAEPRAIPLAHPDQRDVAHLQLELHAGESMATSANTVKAKPHPDGIIGHLLNPRSGWPASDFGSVTVICPKALDADALSTALFVLGPDTGLNFAESEAGVEAIFLIRAPSGIQVTYTSGLEGRIHPAPGSPMEPLVSTP
jgi:thiamine biosynthesis lipoprotein